MRLWSILLIVFKPVFIVSRPAYAKLYLLKKLPRRFFLLTLILGMSANTFYVRYTAQTLKSRLLFLNSFALCTDVMLFSCTNVYILCLFKFLSSFNISFNSLRNVLTVNFVSLIIIFYSLDENKFSKKNSWEIPQVSVSVFCNWSPTKWTVTSSLILCSLPNSLIKLSKFLAVALRFARVFWVNLV